jgi:hypothetical protein
MTAKEMFEKLGYYYYVSRNKKSFGYLKKSVFERDLIKFKITEKQILKEKNITGDPAAGITLEELQAINKQVEELGWNNENN